jgi:biotin operon repressor
MCYRVYTQQLNNLLELIERGQLKSPSDAAFKFECSEKSIRRMINHLRSDGYEIIYSKPLKKYLITKK